MCVGFRVPLGSQKLLEWHLNTRKRRTLLKSTYFSRLAARMYAILKEKIVFFLFGDLMGQSDTFFGIRGHPLKSKFLLGLEFHRFKPIFVQFNSSVFHRVTRFPALA